MNFFNVNWTNSTPIMVDSTKIESVMTENFNGEEKVVLNMVSGNKVCVVYDTKEHDAAYVINRITAILNGENA